MPGSCPQTVRWRKLTIFNPTRAFGGGLGWAKLGPSAFWAAWG